AMRWDALLTFGTYYQVNRMKKELALVRQAHPGLLADPKNQLTIARLLFWNADYQEAWSMTRAIASGKDPLPQTWILVGDLFTFTQKMRNIGQGPLHTQIREFLAGQGKQIATIGILQPILIDVLHPQMNLAKLASLDALDREPASAPGPGTAGQLKARVDAIGKVLRALEQQQSVLHAYTKSPAAQIAVAGLCASPLLKQEAIRRLEQQKENPIAAKQWGDLVAKIGVKIAELQSIARQEQASCDQQRQNIAYMKPSKEIVSPLCDEYSCYPTVPKSMEDVLAFEEERRKSPKDRLDAVRQYLTIGAWAPAEVLAFAATSPKERTLLLAVIRLAMGDTWNAAPLFKEVTGDPQQAPHAYLMLAGIAWRHGHLRLAADQLSRIRQGAKLLDWEEKIYDQIKDSVGKLLTEAPRSFEVAGF
ncbi:MAG TPA: hypothetical protein VM598_13010, partial [Bdellovibrionota bacterium]|nr:hypothetical protein [Bdellovibrionota bacterium]